MSNLLELYQETLLDHAQAPRHVGRLEQPTGSASGNNPLCGDRITVDVRCVNEIVEDISFESSGCAISLASASVMAEQIVGKSKAEVLEICASFLAVLTNRPDESLIELSDLPEDLQAFSGVNKFPMRVKCATIAWHALREALS